MRWLLLCLMLVMATSAAGQSRVPLQSRDVAWIRGGWLYRGATHSDLVYAADLCRHARQNQSHLCSEDLFVTELPARRVWVSDFGIDRTEVTNAQWRRCVLAGRCPPSRTREGDTRIGRPEHPVSGVTWAEAQRYCEVAGGRLPSEAEWERAARGSDRRRFPWGNVFNVHFANHGKGNSVSGADGFRFAAPVGSYPQARSPFGIFDLAGNVWEWTADGWDDDFYAESLSVDPRGPGDRGQYVVRGGSWLSSPETLRVTTRVPVAAGHSAPDLGFRCAYER